MTRHTPYRGIAPYDSLNRMHIIRQGRVIRERILAADVTNVISVRDKNYPGASIYVLDRDYAMTREIIDVETGEYEEYFM